MGEKTAYVAPSTMNMAPVVIVLMLLKFSFKNGSSVGKYHVTLISEIINKKQLMEMLKNIKVLVCL